MLFSAIYSHLLSKWKVSANNHPVNHPFIIPLFSKNAFASAGINYNQTLCKNQYF